MALVGWDSVWREGREYSTTTGVGASVRKWDLVSGVGEGAEDAGVVEEEGIPDLGDVAGGDEDGGVGFEVRDFRANQNDDGFSGDFVGLGLPEGVSGDRWGNQPDGEIGAEGFEVHLTRHQEWSVVFACFLLRLRFLVQWGFHLA